MQMFKRALADAVGSGKEWIGWTTGETQAARYDLSKQVDRIEYFKNPNGKTYDISAYKDDSKVISQPTTAPDQIEGLVGKELAQKILKGENLDSEGVGTFAGDNLKVGGEGMKGFYDQILPKEISKYVKQWGAQVEKGSIGGAAKIEKRGSSWYATLSSGERQAFSDEDGARQYAEKANQEATPIWRVNITPQMREGIKKAGQALFVGGMAAVVAEQEEQ
jgi:hypothetical protein